MALTAQEQSTLDSLLNTAQTFKQFDLDIWANMPNTVHPPEPDVFNYYKSKTNLTPAQQSMLNELYKKYGF